MAAHRLFRSWPRLIAAAFTALALAPLAAGAADAFKVRLTPVPIEASSVKTSAVNPSSTGIGRPRLIALMMSSRGPFRPAASGSMPSAS